LPCHINKKIRQDETPKECAKETYLKQREKQTINKNAVVPLATIVCVIFWNKCSREVTA
jgi:hypothetical protein